MHLLNAKSGQALRQIPRVPALGSCLSSGKDPQYLEMRVMRYRSTKGCESGAVTSHSGGWAGGGGGEGFQEDRTLVLGHGRSLQMRQEEKVGRPTLTESATRATAWRSEGVYVVCFQNSSYHTTWLF